MLEYMYNEINCGSSSFYCLRVTSRQKQWPSSQSLNYYVHMLGQQARLPFFSFFRFQIKTKALLSTFYWSLKKK